MNWLKSGIILKDRIYMPDHDNHARMLEELGIAGTTENASRMFVCAELIPERDEIFSSVDSWKFRVKQDIFPDWFVAELDKQRMVEAVKEWAERHIFVGKSDFNINTGIFYLKDCNAAKAYDSTINVYSSTVEAHNSIVRAFGTSTVKAYSSTAFAYNSTVKAYGSTVHAYNSSVIEAYNNSTVSASDSTVNASDSTVNAYSSTVEAHNNSTVIISNYSSTKLENITLHNNSTLKYYKTKTIYQSGNWKFVAVQEGKQ